MLRTLRRTALALATTTALAVVVATPALASAPHATFAQRMAIAEARNYLASQAFSRQGLIEQLDSPYGGGFRKAVAVYAVNHIRVNWGQQAVRSARQYLASQPFSKSALYQQLVSPYGAGFTPAQARYGVNRVYR
jgi:Host cell surface-exposed lipoprotein